MIINHARQQTQFTELLNACSEAGSTKIAEWDLLIQQWEEDHSKPDPYDESEYGEQSTYIMARYTLIMMFYSCDAV